MNKCRIWIVVVMTFVLNAVAGPAFSGQTERPFPPPPMMGLSGICVHGEYLYVMAGGKIMEYSLDDLTTVKSSVDLPKPAPPTSAQMEAAKSGLMPPHPPMGGGPHGLWPADNVLYVLAGPMVYTCTIPGLSSIQAAVELQKPDLPNAGR